MRFLLTVIAVIGLNFSAFANDATGTDPDQARRDAYQLAVEDCLHEKGIKDDQCWVTDKLGIHCVGDIDSDKSIRKECSAKANASLTPKRREVKK